MHVSCAAILHVEFWIVHFTCKLVIPYVKMSRFHKKSENFIRENVPFSISFSLVK